MDKMIFKDSIAATAASAENQQEVMGTAAEEASNVEQAAANGGGERKPRPELDEALMCPRCHSNDTKFCYYNNHSLLQPRYLCKACRRYWTQGGTLRHVREGSACRKIRRTSSSLSPSSSSIDKQPQQHLPPASSIVEQDFPNFLPAQLQQHPVPVSSIVKQEFPDMLPTQLQLMPIEHNFPDVLPMQLQQHLAPVSSTVEQDFPNVLPTFMSSCFDLPGSHLSFPPLSLSSLPPAPPLPSGVETLSFMDLLTGSFDYQSNCINGPTSSGMEAPPFGFSVVKQNGVVGDDHGGAPPIGGGEGTSAASTHQGGQWPMIKQEFGADQEEEEGAPDTAGEK